ncbi:MAG: M23 family metallopeptidase [Gammaproteobacteria bacterium]|nr:M23 family metallopeptidase [Gammaproteobacteria bacterium]
MRALVVAMLATAAQAADLPAPELSGPWTQGAAVTGRVAPGSQVWFKGRELRVSPEGRFVFGLSRDEPPEAELRLKAPGGAEQVLRYAVQPREYPIQRIDGLPQAMVTPPAEALKRIELDNQRVAAARASDTARPDFASGYEWPVVGRISGVYGSQRILNGEPRQPHFGVDIAAPAGTPVKAAGGGVVRLARADLYYTGGTVILDHGHGMTSTYLHLSKLHVQEGQEVAKGQLIGEVGATGRATGPHLCFRMNWFDTRLDAQLLVGPMPELGKAAP